MNWTKLAVLCGTLLGSPSALAFDFPLNQTVVFNVDYVDKLGSTQVGTGSVTVYFYFSKEGRLFLSNDAFPNEGSIIDVRSGRSIEGGFNVKIRGKQIGLTGQETHTDGKLRRIKKYEARFGTNCGLRYSMEFGIAGQKQMVTKGDAESCRVVDGRP